MGESHPLLADAACRNTLFNATAQSVDTRHLSDMRTLGIRHFRLEFLHESAIEIQQILSTIGQQMSL